MPSHAADRNLLLGILAVQNGFVPRDALFDAMLAWTARKEISLGTLLVERGELAKNRCDLLEMLVDEHIKAHGGDPARSLLSVSSVGSVADDLAKLSDPDIQASVAYVRSMTPPDPDDAPESRAPTSFGEPTSWNGRFRVVRPHASGGLGVVSVAMDDELDREVAFKEIREKFADSDSKRSRFVLEAEITGKLEHPGIIPIYGLGHDPTGRPFYAMRFIRGDSLSDAINRFHDPNGPYKDPAKRSLQLRELLGRFLDVCDAMAYAHSRGVLHRDLKPGNIMLGPFGETLVVDWGLALPLDRVPEGHESTHGAIKSTKVDSASLIREQGAVIGTPAYMPPEQAEGLVDQLGPRSDVYGLGAILYELLTGKLPTEGSSLEETLKFVREGRIQPPRQVRPEITRSLEAICLKALSLKPEGRYDSPRSLAADIKKWLADDPVSAMREPLSEKARRWAKRNRTIVTGVAASLLVGLIGLGSVAGVLATKNKALDIQRKRAEKNESEAIDAVKRFRDAIVNEPELKQNKALGALRKRLLNEPLAFFKRLRERLTADQDTTPESLTRLAQAYFDLAYLTNEIGDKLDALNAYRGELEIRRKLAAATPAGIQLQSNMALCHNNIGILLSATGETDAALHAHHEAMALQQTLVASNPAVTQFQIDLAVSYSNIGNLLKATTQTDQRLQAYREALAISRKVASSNPSETRSQRALAGILNNIGGMLSESGQMLEALKSLKESLAIRRQIAKVNPADTEFQSEMAISHNNIGHVLTEIGQLHEGLQAFREALVIQQKLAEANPAVTEFQSKLAASHYNISLLLMQIGQADTALQACREALAIFQKLADANPSVTQFQSDLANSRIKFSTLLEATGRFDAALLAYREALTIIRKLADVNPADAELQKRMAKTHYNMGRLLKNTGQVDAAVQAYGEALSIQQKLTKDDPESAELANLLGGTLNNLAMVDLETKRFEKARELLREAVAWQRKALATNPANPTYRMFLRNHWINLREAAIGMNDTEGIAEAERELAALRDSDPAVMALDHRLAIVLKGQEPPRNNAERLQLAQRAYDKSLQTAAAKLWAEAFAADPKAAESRNPQYRYNAACASALAGCGQGKDEPALDEAQKAKLRGQALAWLQAELAVWSQILEKDPAQARPFIVQTLQHWKEDSDLAGVRDLKAIEALPEAERAPWVELWRGVDALIEKASKPKE